MNKDHSESVRDHFSNQWKEYDIKIRKVIPYYDDGFLIILNIIQKLIKEPKSVLEIGIGTGNLSFEILNTFKNVNITGIDFVNDYINIAIMKLKKYRNQINLLCMDIKDYDFDKKFDVVVTSFVFHHLTDTDKVNIYKKIYNSLNKNGILINYDFVDSSSKLFSKIFDDLRIQEMKNQGVDNISIQKDYIEHRELEFPTSITEQFKWLSKIGFSELECIWKYLNLAIFVGKK